VISKMQDCIIIQTHDVALAVNGQVERESSGQSSGQSPR
jgi:hypothetical protein